jgi:5-enolpyruvylshikimate-3-phosphate synthase
MAHFDRTLVVIVHFLVVVAESLRHCSPEETYKLKKLVYELIKLNPKNSKSSTLLHLASSRDSSSIIKNHTLSSFPSTEVLKLLLECGADPNSLDGERNSPLHLAAANRNSPITTAAPTAGASQGQAAATAAANGGVVVVGNVGTGTVAVAAAHLNALNNTTTSNVLINSERDKIICLLLNAGTHLDACNANNKTAADLYKGGKMYNVINPINYVNLQCLAAKVIQKYKIPYREHLTLKLANFVSIH